jgi:hypothetical protein
MKKNKKPKKQVVSELADHFSKEFEKQLPVTPLPNGGVVYKNYIIKRNSTDNWEIYYATNKSSVEQFFLKSCALMAAKAYDRADMTKFFEIKDIDNKYWANHCDNIVYKNNIKTAKEFERYVILLNKLEDSEAREDYYKSKISQMFKWSFA